MKQLTIKVKGSVTESNFNEYRDEILSKISGINTDLKTDNDFSEAKKIITLCRDAETHLDVALEIAISEAADISNLFDSVRTVIGTLKSTRLDLSRKVKEEEQSRRADIISEARKLVQDFLDNQVPVIRNMAIDFSIINQSAKGKRGISGVSKAVDKAALEMIEEIKLTCNHVGENDLIFHTIALSHNSLFPDHNKLLFLPELEMVEVIEGRIAKADLEAKAREDAAKEAKSQKEAEDKARAELEAKSLAQSAKNEPTETFAAPATTHPPPIEQKQAVSGTNSTPGTYQAVINFNGEKSAVQAIYSELKSLLSGYNEVISGNLVKT